MAYNSNADYSNINDGLALSIQVLILGGLLLIACSKQKVEDEMIRHIRLNSLQYAVVIFVLLRLSYKVIGYFTGDESWMPQFQANFLITLYILIFYYQLTIRPALVQLITKTQKNEK